MNPYEFDDYENVLSMYTRRGHLYIKTESCKIIHTKKIIFLNDRPSPNNSIFKLMGSNSYLLLEMKIPSDSVTVNLLKVSYEKTREASLLNKFFS